MRRQILFVTLPICVAVIVAGTWIADAGDLIISQLPNQSNGIFSDCDCDFCGGLQILAEQFVLTEETIVGQMRAWIGFYPGDSATEDQVKVIFHEDAGGVPGAAVYTFMDIPYVMEETGIMLFGVHEWLVTMTMPECVTLGPGTWWVQFYWDTAGSGDSVFWEVGDPDFTAGIPGQDWGTDSCPIGAWNLGPQDMAYELIEGSCGAPINDCNENGIPDDCECDCDGNGAINDCDEDYLCGDMDPVDGDVDGADYAILLAAMGSFAGDANYSECADLDCDGAVTLVDYQLWLECWHDYIGDPLAPPPDLETPLTVPAPADPGSFELPTIGSGSQP